MESIQEDDGKKGKFTLYSGEKKAGEIIYNWAGPDKLIIEHTEVYPGFEGQGIGKILVMKVVELARLKLVKVLPLCPYAKALFQKQAELGDVLF
ncbi:MAG TPA: GNAT family N-acetyltransferase [Bacteroidia bacterium]|nr:GNAT family N-acetyltransferase [Bacteroidia bacterium]